MHYIILHNKIIFSYDKEQTRFLHHDRTYLNVDSVAEKRIPQNEWVDFTELDANDNPTKMHFPQEQKRKKKVNLFSNKLKCKLQNLVGVSPKKKLNESNLSTSKLLLSVQEVKESSDDDTAATLSPVCQLGSNDYCFL